MFAIWENWPICSMNSFNYSTNLKVLQDKNFLKTKKVHIVSSCVLCNLVLVNDLTLYSVTHFNYTKLSLGYLTIVFASGPLYLLCPCVELLFLQCMVNSFTSFGYLLNCCSMRTCFIDPFLPAVVVAIIFSCFIFPCRLLCVCLLSVFF